MLIDNCEHTSVCSGVGKFYHFFRENGKENRGMFVILGEHVKSLGKLTTCNQPEQWESLVKKQTDVFGPKRHKLRSKPFTWEEQREDARR